MLGKGSSVLAWPPASIAHRTLTSFRSGPCPHSGVQIAQPVGTSLVQPSSWSDDHLAHCDCFHPVIRFVVGATSKQACSNIRASSNRTQHAPVRTGPSGVLQTLARAVYISNMLPLPPRWTSETHLADVGAGMAAGVPVRRS